MKQAKVERTEDVLARIAAHIAATLGFVQGLTWAVLSFTAIMVSTWEHNINIPTSYTELLGKQIFQKYLKEFNSEGTDSPFIIGAFEFNIFMWIYFILSICWIAISLDLYTAVIARRNLQATCMLLWGGATSIISFLDLIFLTLLASDYSSCSVTGLNLTDTDCYLTTGIVMTIAARGFTLWIINIIFAVLLIIISLKMHKRRRFVRNFLGGGVFVKACGTGVLNLRRSLANCKDWIKTINYYLHDLKASLLRTPSQSQGGTTTGTCPLLEAELYP